MTAPLALYLTRFSAPPPDPIRAAPPEPDDRIALTPAELEAALDAARRETAQRHADEIAARIAAHEAELESRLAAARADWAARESEVFAAKIDAGLDELRVALADRIAAAMRPLLGQAAAARVQAGLVEAIERLLADPAAPTLIVRGPSDLLEVLRARCPAASIAWVVEDGIDVTLAAGATRIDSKLAAALGALGGTED